MKKIKREIVGIIARIMYTYHFPYNPADLKGIMQTYSAIKDDLGHFAGILADLQYSDVPDDALEYHLITLKEIQKKRDKKEV